MSDDARSERRVALAMFGFVALAFVGTCQATRTEARWAAELYPNEELRGTPVREWHEKLRFNWKKRAPAPGFPKDGFSARWTTCLVVPETREVAFLLTSDDGSVLYVNGERLIDNGGEHPRATKGAVTRLERGVHLVRVEYREHAGRAMVGLSASLDGRAPRQIPWDRLRRPEGGRCPEE